MRMIKTIRNMIKTIRNISALLLASAMIAVGFTACTVYFGDKTPGSGGEGPGVTAPAEDLEGIPERPDGEVTKLFDFAGKTDLSSLEGWHAANGYGNDPSLFGCKWSWDNVWVGDDGLLRLELREPNGDGNITGGEFRTYGTYGHGYYSVRMKPMKADGVISSFFTYTNRPHWDEIDIEFLGDDTTKVQFNYYTEGEGGHEFVYHLGYDASEEFHSYGFEWTENSIIWYVDGKPVHKATADIPTAEQQIMMNLWPIAESGPDNWAGVYKGDLGTAYYEWAGFDPAD